ncbi:hypothetical protein FQZ97_771500 [compost metagenome]
MTERDPGGASPERSRKLLPSEEMFLQARQAQREIEMQTLSFDELDMLARHRCKELNDTAQHSALIGEKISVDAGRVVVVNNVHQKYESQQVDGREPDEVERLERISGSFAGYGFYITPQDGGYACTLGAKIITGYDRTLPFSEAAAVAFCPVGVSSPEFDREHKDHRLEDARAEVRRAIDMVDWQAADALSALDVVYEIADIDRLMTGKTIEDVGLLNNISLRVSLLLKQLESVPKSELIATHLLELLSTHLELPQRLDVSAHKYRSPIGTSTGWMVYMDPGGQPRELPDFEAHLVMAPAALRSELFLIGMHEDRPAQVALSDIVSIKPEVV